MFTPRNIRATVYEYRWILVVLGTVSTCLSIAHRVGVI